MSQQRLRLQNSKDTKKFVTQHQSPRENCLIALAATLDSNEKKPVSTRKPAVVCSYVVYNSSYEPRPNLSDDCFVLSGVVRERPSRKNTLFWALALISCCLDSVVFYPSPF